MNHDGAARPQRGVRLAQKTLTLLGRPVVENLREKNGVEARGEVLFEHVPRLGAHLPGDSGAIHVPARELADHGQIPDHAVHMRPRTGDGDRQRTGSAPHIEHTLHSGEVHHLGQSGRGALAHTVHGRGETAGEVRIRLVCFPRILAAIDASPIRGHRLQ